MKHYTPRRKYGNVKVNYNGREYDSKKESQRAFELDMLLRAGEILEWQPQSKFDLKVNGQLICRYIADFRVVYKDHHVEYEDVKSDFTRKLPVYRMKYKLMKAIHNIEIKEI